MYSSFTRIVSILLVSVSVVAHADVTSKTREYRPLEAKKVRISPAAKVDFVNQQELSVIDALRDAWSQFDDQKWDEAMETFVSALEADPKSSEAAEGLAMSIYRSGDYASAYRLGEELKDVMPSVQEMVADTALADSKAMVAKGKFVEARSFLAHFPAEGATLSYAHNMLETAFNLTNSVDKGDDQPEATKSLAKN